MTEMTDGLANAMARVIEILRPGWDHPGIFAALRRIHDRPAEDACVAAVRAAMDPACLTPGVLPLDGPHWHERVAPPSRVPAYPTLDRMCSRCTQDLRSCGCGAPSMREFRARTPRRTAREIREVRQQIDFSEPLHPPPTLGPEHAQDDAPEPK